MTTNGFGEEVDMHEWFRAQLAMTSQRQLARDLGVHQAVISRNAQRLRRGLKLSEPLATAIKSRMMSA